MTRYCPHPELVGATLWLPNEPFEYGWAELVGCNHLRCRRCSELVHGRVLDDGQRRHYECRCQRHDEIWRYRVDASDDLVAGPMGWHCDGHPELVLPAVLDGVDLRDDADWRAVARLSLGQMPFQPPGVDLAAPWVTRLYRLLAGDAARAALGEAIADATGDHEPAVVAAALEFFMNEPAAAGADRLAALIPARRTWLTATAHPERPSTSLLRTAALALHERLLVVDARRQPIDAAALALTKSLALDGVTPSTALLSLHDYDPDWLWDHAADLVRANRDSLSRIVYLSRLAPSESRIRGLQSVARVDEATYRALCAKIATSYSEPERSALLTAIAPPVASLPPDQVP